MYILQNFVTIFFFVAIARVATENLNNRKQVFNLNIEIRSLGCG